MPTSPGVSPVITKRLQPHRWLSWLKPTRSNKQTAVRGRQGEWTPDFIIGFVFLTSKLFQTRRSLLSGHRHFRGVYFHLVPDSRLLPSPTYPLRPRPRSLHESHPRLKNKERQDRLAQIGHAPQSRHDAASLCLFRRYALSPQPCNQS